MTRTATLIAAAFLGLAATTGQASATIYQIDYPNVWQAYDNVNDTYSMKFNNTTGADGFWLVVSDGENPKNNVNEYAILYGDLTNNRITAYTYNGQNAANSFANPGEYIATYNNVFDFQANDMIQFDIDVAKINNFVPDNGLPNEWDGVQLGALGGIWFHQSTGSQFSYDGQGAITEYTFTGQTWLDRANDPSFTRRSPDCLQGETARGFANPCDATQGEMLNMPGNPVPAPGGLALLIAGLAGLRLRRKG